MIASTDGGRGSRIIPLDPKPGSKAAE